MTAERDARRVSSALIEARTILSRAETARAALRHSTDPAASDIAHALDELIERLAPYRRIRSGCPECGAPGRPHVDNSIGRPYWKRYTCEVPRG
ncbi:hypothetical protein SEA_MABODAMACA_43 [Microbacterium phage Mabodamaca]|uniref:Uncharacterized protein n=1 Tax=Microbacterium phage Mabodamaca TaxID=3078574 RepID=A0AA96NGU2_9CAUD|nr:hypothetical protein SEA_MABODAMACA_43 [Microbacterium phage Mabodamaca]